MVGNIPHKENHKVSPLTTNLSLLNANVWGVPTLCIVTAVTSHKHENVLLL